MQRLSADLVPFIGDASVSLALVRVLSEHWTPVPGSEMERGEIRLAVAEAIRPADWQTGQEVEITGNRLADLQARLRSNFDQWNVLSFEPGSYLLMAARQGKPLAADAVSGSEDPTVEGLRRAVAIEGLPPAARPEALADALASPVDLLRDYALDAIGRRAMVSREVGAQLITSALPRRDLPVASQLPLTRELASRHFYRFELGDDPTNVLVVRWLAAMLVKGDRKLAGVWSQLLAAALLIQFSPDPVKDAALRKSLMQHAGDPRRIIEELERQLNAGSKDPRLPKLIEQWRASAV